MKQLRMLVTGLALVAALTLGLGCKPSGKDAKGTAAAKTDKGGKDDHAHGEGPHGGAVADWGGGKYHIEFAVDHDKQEATVYILDSSVKKAVPIKAKDGKINASITGVKDKGTFDVVLKALPQTGDPEGKASRFVGQHEKIGVEQEFAGTIVGEVDGIPYTGDFKEEPAKKK